MKISVTLDDQPRDFIRRQPPEAKRALRDALRAVESGQIFPEALGGELDGFYKVKVGVVRMVLEALAGESGPRFRVVFAEKRNVVYVLFSQLIEQPHEALVLAFVSRHVHDGLDGWLGVEGFANLRRQRLRHIFHFP